jgi:hypothetical protein
VCNNPAQLEGLEVDQYIWGILSGVANNKMDVEEITIDPDANWKAHPTATSSCTSSKDDDEDGPPTKRLKNEYNPTTPQTPASIKKPLSNKTKQLPPPHLIPSTAFNGGLTSHPDTLDENLDVRCCCSFS